ncbi:LLM class flavin-dependent oxidoreductase [Egibacter rhizosphaerae]|uniref:LLM class flavin-dependent oxidoreductase n=1 Tax=Egibacter rhizosphaerae TaxID=1670831 RepID=A0A411YHC1_9ACTN|nr:LLM class flavin-dependent oxidoreductase [Egibacter rhizosphaerae]QBI20506.1 LLM class flavin-dependent oxidoreductase [Egibacter rhizosphaerae]
MTVKFGLMLCNQHPAGDPMDERFAELTEQVQVARDLGFDLIASGHHYLSEPLQLFQPVPLLARIAADAGDMRIASCVFLAGLTNPVQLAEDVATLDAITRGRFVMSVALGYRDVEFDAFNVPKGERTKRFVSNVDTAVSLLEGETVSLDAPHTKLDEVRMGLDTIQQPRPPLWMGANSDKALRRAAERAEAWLINPHGRLDALARQINEVYRPALEELGKPFPSEMPIRREIFVSDDRPTAMREAAPWLLPKYQTYYRQWGQHKALPADDEWADEAEELVRDRFVLGSPEECIAEIDRYREELGATTFLVRAQWPGMPQEEALGNIRRIGETLVPHYQREAAAGR